MKGSTLRRGKTWTAYWSTIDPASGSRRQHTRGGFRTKKAAQEHLNTILVDVDNNTWTAQPRNITLGAYLMSEWLPAQRSRGLRPTTLAQYRGVIEHWIVPHVGGLQLAALSPAHVQGLYDQLLAEGSVKTHRALSGRSVQLTATVLRAALTQAVRHGLVARNVAQVVARPRPREHEMQSWDEAETVTFLDHVTGDRLEAAWRLFLTLGPRRGEVAGLRRHDLDLDARQIHIRHTLVLADGKPVTSSPKTSAGRRTVPLDHDTAAMLRSHLARQAEERLAAGPAWEDSGYIFTDELGRPYDPNHYSYRWKCLVAGAGLRKISLHGARHTAASALMAAGVSPRVVQQILGHSRIAVTLGVYGHVIPGQAEQAIEQRAQALRRRAG